MQSLRTQLDPARTVFAMDPPREFPSVAAMDFFLKQNDEIRAKHLAWQAQAISTPAPSESTVVTASERFATEELGAGTETS